MITALLLGLVVACSSKDDDPAKPAPRATVSETAEPGASAGVEPCDLLSVDQVEELAGGPVGEAKPGLTGGMPNCRWEAREGAYVQTITATASEWAQSLPQAFRAVSELDFVDEEDLAKLRKGAELVEAGGVMDATEACAMFATMVELQGRPPGSNLIVNVVPSKDNPLAVTGQMCSSGRFTSVMLANRSGLGEPLPGDLVLALVRAAHRKAIV